MNNAKHPLGIIIYYFVKEKAFAYKRTTKKKYLHNTNDNEIYFWKTKQNNKKRSPDSRPTPLNIPTQTHNF